MKKIVLLLAAVILFGGCSTRYNSLDEKGKPVAWEGEKTKMLAEMKSSFAEVFPGRNIFPVGENGFSTWQRFVLDKHTHEALLMPYNGAIDNGEKKEAYSLKVTSSGTMANGSSKSRELFENIMGKFDAIFRRVGVK